MARTVRKSALKEIRPSEIKDDRLENDPRFLRRIEQARDSLRAARGVALEDLEPE
jgi:hypothetical protein